MTSSPGTAIQGHRGSTTYQYHHHQYNCTTNNYLDAKDDLSSIWKWDSVKSRSPNLFDRFLH